MDGTDRLRIRPLSGLGAETQFALPRGDVAVVPEVRVERRVFELRPRVRLWGGAGIKGDDGGGLVGRRP
eukprot:54386-Pyramimonas_sp.AAC.1